VVLKPSPLAGLGEPPTVFPISSPERGRRTRSGSTRPGDLSEWAFSEVKLRPLICPSGVICVRGPSDWLHRTEFVLPPMVSLTIERSHRSRGRKNER
jgi:hypothetical protein